MWSAYTWVVVVALAVADIEWITDENTGKRYAIQSAAAGDTRDTVQKSCVNIGANLPLPRNWKENNFVLDLTKNNKDVVPYLGLYGSDNSDDWFWSQNGERISWSVWNDNRGRTNDKRDCAYMWKKYYGSWFITGCAWKFRTELKFICEKAPIDHTNLENWITHRRTRKQYIDLEHFAFLSRSMSHADSQDRCKSVVGFLPAPMSEAENNFLASLQGKTFRLGMRYKALQDVWKWDQNANRVTWFNWVDPSLERRWNSCVALAPNQDHHGWRDIKCDGFNFFGAQPSTLICEKDNDWTTDEKTTKQYLRQMRSSHGTKTSYQEHCEQIGGFLVSPMSREENSFVYDLQRTMRGTRLRYHYQWLGIHRDTNSYRRWLYDRDGFSIEWSNWEKFSPVDKHNCAIMDGRNGKWISMPTCEKTRGGNDMKSFICERAYVEPTTTTTTAKPVPTKRSVNWMKDPATGKDYFDLDTTGHLSHQASQERCSSIGGFLPEPRQTQENDFLATVTSKDFRLGMSYITAGSGSGGVWKWEQDGSTASWFNWIQSPQPQQGNIKCAAVMRSVYTPNGFKGWNGVDCDDPFGRSTVVCEKRS